MIRVVFSYVQGSGIPATPLSSFCLVEDDNGSRLLVTDSDYIDRNIWADAVAQGAVAVAWWDFGTVRHCTMEQFDLLHRDPLDPRMASMVLMPEHPFLLDHHEVLSYVALLARQADAQPRPLSFVNVHTHTDYSPLDGLSKVEEIVAIAAREGQPALGVTDHGYCSSHLYLQEECDKVGIKPLFGLEAYFVDDRFERPMPGDKENQDRLHHGYYHLCLWAETDEGLRNLWAMSTAAHREGFYYHPRLDWDVLERYGAGVCCSTACLRGPVSVPLKNDDEDLARSNLARLLNVFGDRLWAEFHVNHLPEQIKVNERLVTLAGEMGVPLLAAVDSHYPCASDKEAHQVWLSIQTDSDLIDDTGLFSGAQDYHLMGRDEALARLAAHYPSSVVDEAIGQTLVLAERCGARILKATEPPIFSSPHSDEARMDPALVRERRIQRDVEHLVDLCLSNWDRKVVGKTKPESVYEERFEFEMRMLIDKSFTGYFNIVADYVRWAKQRCLVGPGRGSGGASLVAYLCDITEIDPVEADLEFARFMTKGRTEPPDFDIDFPASFRPEIQHYVAERWGEDHVVRVGTQTRLLGKGIFRQLPKVLKSIEAIEFTDVERICKIIEAEEADSAGLGKPWEVIWANNEDILRPYAEKYPIMFALVDKLVGRVKSYGKHPAGIVISSAEALTGRLPMHRGDEDQMVSDFDMHAMEFMGLLKFDFLTLRTLDTLQANSELIKARRGVSVQLADWRDEYNDPQVWDVIAGGQTMGMFQAETTGVTALVRRIQPDSLEKLAAIITLVRPGPTRSGLTETYIRRLHGLEEVTYPDPRLEPVLASTYGAIIYQEQVMQVCRILAGYDDEEADHVRKILGKKKIDQVEAEGRKFTAACVERGMEVASAQVLWRQLAEFALYSFNKSHAWAYAVIGFYCAWFKVHYTPEFLTAALSTVDKDRIPDFVNEARRMGFKVLPPDVNLSKEGFTPYNTEVRYSLAAVKGIGETTQAAVVSGQPYTSFEDFLDRKGPGCHSDHVALLAAVGAFDSLVPNRRALEAKLAYEASPEAIRCVHRDDSVIAPHGLPCGFDWTSEPIPLGKKGQPLKSKIKPIPTSCTRGCRHYTAPAPVTVEAAPYSDDDIRDREMELLGIYLSSTPFDRLDPADLAECRTADDIEGGPPGEYLTAAVVKTVKTRVDRNGHAYAFVTLFAQTTDIDVACFSQAWARFHKVLNAGKLVLAIITKGNDLRLRLDHVITV